ncbi:MAG: hypothetical protein QM753_03360 [Thermomicrobiales bacterium]
MRRLSDVNTTDLRGAIALGCETMGRVFDRDDHGYPFFAATVLPEARMAFNDSHSESHVPGRHLNALLVAESVLGIAVPDEVIEGHARAAYFSYSELVALPLNRDRIDGYLVRFLPHNLREGFHALYALAHFRQDERAFKLIDASIAAIRAYWSFADGWDANSLGREYQVQVHEWPGPFITGIARALGPLVKIHRTLGIESAYDLATELRNELLDGWFTPEGLHDIDRFGTHTHSTTCALSSLAQYADTYDDIEAMDAVQAFYDRGLPAIANHIGWSIENCGPDANPDRGECNNSGDILETALILGRRRDSAYFQDGERIIRSHLLPAQLRDIAFVPPSAGTDDGTTDVAQRLRGAFGFPAPYGHAPIGAADVGFNLDIVGGTVASLCEAVREGVTHNGDVTSINLLFDHDDERCTIESPYTHDALTIRTTSARTVVVHLPDWADLAVIDAALAQRDAARSGRKLTISSIGPDTPLTLPLSPPIREGVISHRDRDREVRTRGDEVIAMDAAGADLLFFPPMTH